jgi:hypothetical protein
MDGCIGVFEVVKFHTKRHRATELHHLLDSGLPDTKTWLRSLPEKQMDKVLERYYSLEAFEFMRRILQ